MTSPLLLPNVNTLALGRVHARRLRDVYRSAGWPSQDKVEVELLAANMLTQVRQVSGHETVKLTDAGIDYLALAYHSNRQARSAHEALVAQVAQTMQRDGRIVWTHLSLRARVASSAETPTLARWKICKPDVFSVRNTTVAGYLEPVVHEVKVSRADLLGDLKCPDKRGGYLNVGGQCWYVLGCDSKGRPIAEPDEIPLSCGVMVYTEGRLDRVRHAPRRSTADLTFGVWMALAKATPLCSELDGAGHAPTQSVLTNACS